MRMTLPVLDTPSDRNIDILSVCPTGLRPVVDEGNGLKNPLGAQAVSLCSAV